jgi:thioredoxin-related protein
MKNYFKAATLILLSLTVMAFVGPIKVKFLSADWSAAQQKAKTEKKLYFVDFDASYCASCRNMDASTYQDPALASFMENNVVALRLDVQDFEGAMWSQNYEVEALPTMLIFNQDGKLVKRIVGYKSAKELMAAFNEVLPKKDIKTEAVKPVDQKVSSPQPVVDDEKPALKPVTTNANLANKTPSSAGLYELNVKRFTSNGFSIQIGVYNSYDFMLEQAEKLSDKFPTQKILMHVDDIGGQRTFKLLIGNFYDKIQASEFKESLRKSGFDGILKDLSVLR